jgi:hypothetical protein
MSGLPLEALESASNGRRGQMVDRSGAPLVVVGDGAQRSDPS